MSKLKESVAPVINFIVSTILKGVILWLSTLIKSKRQK